VFDRERRLVGVDRAQSDQVQTLRGAARIRHRGAQLVDRVVVQTHLLVRDREVVVCLVVALGERLAHALLERLEHRGESVVVRGLRAARARAAVGIVVERVRERGREVEAAVVVARGRRRAHPLGL
jgi:hypothetical protein